MISAVDPLLRCKEVGYLELYSGRCLCSAKQVSARGHTSKKLSYAGFEKERGKNRI